MEALGHNAYNSHPCNAPTEQIMPMFHQDSPGVDEQEIKHCPALGFTSIHISLT